MDNSLNNNENLKIYNYSSIKDVRILNNLFYDSSDITDQELIHYRNQGTINATSIPSPIIENDIFANNLHGDPLFSETVTFNISNINSPCIDFGTGLEYEVYATDYDDDSFPFNSTPDIGPQEYQGSSRLANFIKNEIHKNAFKIYPNPTKDHLYINTIYTVKSVEFFDISNRLINLKHTNNSLDLSTINNGVYTIKITTDQGTFFKKIIKQ